MSDEDHKGNFRTKELREKGFDNTMCRRCKSEGKAVLQAGDYTTMIYLCPSCEHMWGVNYDEKKIEEIPKELPQYDALMEKIREEFRD